MTKGWYGLIYGPYCIDIWCFFWVFKTQCSNCPALQGASRWPHCSASGGRQHGRTKCGSHVSCCPFTVFLLVSWCPWLKCVTARSQQTGRNKTWWVSICPWVWKSFRAQLVSFAALVFFWDSNNLLAMEASNLSEQLNYQQKSSQKYPICRAEARMMPSSDGGRCFMLLFAGTCM